MRVATIPGRKARFLRTCADWPEEDVWITGGLRSMIEEARRITRRQFLAVVDREDRETLETRLGYSLHKSAGQLTMARDRYVDYFSSHHHGQRVYFIQWSKIEYVFGVIDPLAGSAREPRFCPQIPWSSRTRRTGS